MSLKEVEVFEGREVVVSVKLDGENTTIYPDGHSHARSLDSGYHESRTRIRALAARLAPEIPYGWRICGENMVARHEIAYHDVPPFLVFSIWDQDNRCLAWDDVAEWTGLLGLRTAPVLYRGIWDEERIRSLWPGPSGPYADESEGYVVRLTESFHYRDFARSTAKFVRPNHITAARHHWLSKRVVENDIVELD